MKHNDEDEVMNDEDVDEDGSQVKDEDMKEQVAEEEVDDNLIPDFGIPLPDLEFDFDLPGPNALSKHRPLPPSTPR